MATPSIQERLVQLDDSIKQICAVAGTPGLSLVVSHGGEVIHRRHFGVSDVEAQRTVTARTLYPIGTLAKALTASAVALLVDDGRLEWTTAIKDVLPGFRSRSDAVAQELTVVDLLAHRTGLSRANHWWQGVEGVVLPDKSQLLDLYGALPPVGPFRQTWGYSNWGYALVGAVIEAVSGLPYADFVEQRLLHPLGMHKTCFRKQELTTTLDLARPYAALDDASPCRIAYPEMNETLMAPAMGGTATADDLMTYTLALLKSYRAEGMKMKTQTTTTASSGDTAPSDAPNGRQQHHQDQPVLRHVRTQLAGHAVIAPTTPEKTYAMGFYRSARPGTVAGMGANAAYVRAMPALVGPTSDDDDDDDDDNDAVVLAHGGHLPGYTTAMALLPDRAASVVVCTNSIGLGYVSGWVAMAALEALLETPTPSDYAALAAEAAHSCAREVDRVRAVFQGPRPAAGDLTTTTPTSPRDWSRYVGRYRHRVQDWFLDVRGGVDDGSGLRVVFAGLDSQAWALHHVVDDTFVWLADRDEQARRGRMTTMLVAEHFKLVFRADDAGRVQGLRWPYEAGIPEEDQLFDRTTEEYMGPEA